MQAVPAKRAPDNTVATKRLAAILRLSAPALILACALFVPFLHKAYAIDDPYFLLETQQTRRQLLHPLDFNLCWFDSLHCAPAYRLAPGSALMGYFLLPVLAFIASEPVIHLLELMVLFSAVIATVSLALRLGGTDFEARGAGMLLITFPPVLAMTNTVMPDVLVMALSVIGMERFIAWLDGGKIANIGAAVIALGLAPFGRPHAIGLIGVAAVAALLHGRKSGRAPVHVWRAMLPLGIAGALFAGLTFLTRENGTVMALPPASNLGWGRVIPNARALFSDYLICFPITAFWLVQMRRYVVWLIPGAGVTFGILHWAVGLSLGNATVWSLAGLSILCILHLLWQDVRFRSWNPVFVLWFLVPCAVLPYTHLAPKHVMIAAPAAAIAAIGLLRREAAAFRRSVLAVTVAAFAIASLLILHADERFANLSRQATAELVTPNVKKGERVWFAGQWGVYWYALQAGATVVMPDVSEPAPGDLLLTEQFESPNPILDRYPRRQLVRERVFAWDGGRVMSLRSHAGLYTNNLGPLPWSLGSGEVDRFQLWRIN
jgi:hypothetical protein